jgi:7-carboxy-7-deazaguanine synthase
MNELHINEVYPSLQGEGIRAGYPTIFVRTQGCSLRCVWCDTPYGLPFGKAASEVQEGEYVSVDDVVSTVKGFGATYNDVCITGGDPLQQNPEHMLALILKLVEASYYIVIETGGHMPTYTLIDELGANGVGERVSICVDYKLTKSGMTKKMKQAAFTFLRKRDTIKYVVSDMEDWEQAVEHLASQRLISCEATALFSPVWEGQLGVKGLAGAILSSDPSLAPLQLSLQLHKIIWEPAARKK